MPAKKPASKTATKKATVAKKATPAKKSVTTKKNKTSKKSAAKTANMVSFRPTVSDSPFLTIAITRQTLYWGIISVAVLALGMWIIHLQSEVNKIYDAIDASFVEDEPVRPAKAKR